MTFLFPEEPQILPNFQKIQVSKADQGILNMEENCANIVFNVHILYRSNLSENKMFRNTVYKINIVKQSGLPRDDCSLKLPTSDKPHIYQ